VTALSLHCPRCQGTWSIGPLLFGCPACAERGLHSGLEVSYDLAALHPALELGTALPERTIWDFATALPVDVPESRVSLGEGWTPLVPTPALSEEAGVARVLIKTEATNPTGSFKDRLNAVSVSLARQLGFRRVMCTTTGNHGVSLAAYAAAAGLECLVVVAPTIEPLAVRQMRRHGARVVEMEGSPEAGRAWLARLVRDEGWWPSVRNHPRPYANPFGLEGYKTIAYELWHQLQGKLPEWVLVPTGGGDSIAGVARGFEDLRQLGLIERLPRLVACQAQAAAPLVRAWTIALSEVEPVAVGESVAISILEDSTGDHALRALGDSGVAVTVQEADIQRAVASLGAAGLCVEPASAASAAGALLLGVTGQLRPDDTVVCLATASGTRWSATFEGLDGRPERETAGVNA
jgi:threonine synthase